ncbi:hypothetical protein O0L34_g2923 [Tuta absoluta]|nr:hypothetical protein O0L34_g2923 [Tuta absoluta]
MGFAEPPAEHRPAKHLDVPVDSYGAPLRAYINDAILKENTENFENYDIPGASTGPDYGSFNDQHQKDSNINFSNNYESLANPNVLGKYPVDEDFNMDNYVPTKFNEMVNTIKKRPNYRDINKLMNTPWIKSIEEEDKVLVGGQYAEPPGRYVPMYHASDHMIDDRDRYSIGDMETESTATVSPYINYKNSNLAFSPQNLNDAFSIDK